VWSQPLFFWLGAALSVCGVLGLVLAGAGAGPAPIDLVGGIVPGALLFGFALWGSTRGALSRT
jgi:hypothetical protein